MAWEPRIPSPCSLKAITHATGSKIGGSRSHWNRGTEYYPVGMKTHIEYRDIFFWKHNSPYQIEMATYVLIDLLWAGGCVAPTQPTSLRWNWGIFTLTCSTCLEGPYRKDSFGTPSCKAIDRAWEPRIPSPCSLKAITHATWSKIGSSRSRWNRGTEYYHVGMKTHIEYPDIFFENIIILTTLKWAPTFSSIYYEQVALLHPPNRLASDETEEFLPKHVPHV